MSLEIYVLVPMVVVVMGVSFAIGWLLNGRSGQNKIASAEERAKKILADAEREANNLKKEKLLEVKDEWYKKKQEYDHEVAFVIGTITSLIGDPSDRDQARKPQSMEQIMTNAQTYAKQAFKILDPHKTIVHYNDEWLNNLTFPDVINLASKFTVQQFLVRDRLHARIERNEPLWLSELLYPLAQGYDAAFLKSDVQIGATEQLFNLMAGRRIQEAYELKPQICITFPILIGTDGKEKMSKSLGNYIGIDEPAEIQYAKIMSLPDKLIIPYFDLVTRWSREQIDSAKTELEQGRLHPMELKKNWPGRSWIYLIAEKPPTKLLRSSCVSTRKEKHPSK